MTAAIGSDAPFPQLHTFVCGPVRTNVYVLVDPVTRDAAVIDPAPESTAVIERCLATSRATLRMIALTHRHFDHVGEAGPIAAIHRAIIAGHTTDVEYLASAQRSRFFPGYVNPAAPVTRPLAEGDQIALAGVTFDVMHTPGHSGGAICLYHAPTGTLFSGDTLFAGTFGRYDLPDSDAEALRASLRRLATLPADTRVLPGHGRETTIGAETWLADPPID
jgi:glyoxylase-like metal-dependent hydrolase (beta-lactamase superfamily II)